jgi:dienelactone hydrolase
MLQAFFHAWERRLASVSKDRVVRPFEWGLDWIPRNGSGPGADPPPAEILSEWVSDIMRDTDAFYAVEPTSDYRVEKAADASEWRLTFPSALRTPQPENNTVYCRVFPAHSRRRRRTRAAVVVLPQWNADAGGHVGMCRLLAMSEMTAVRVSLPYHDNRMPPQMTRADYIVSSNVARTVQVCRQAVLDARRTVAWLASEGYDRIGILGTSLGSCLSLLTTAHEPLITAQALNHISPFFADVVWRGLSTRHVRVGLEGHVGLDLLRALWKPLSPWWFLDRLGDRQTLLVYARYDLTFPVDLSAQLVREFQTRGIDHELKVLPCGHYSTGKAPFKFVDGWVLTRFLRKALLGPKRSSSADGS